MKLTRIIFLGLAFSLPTTWTVAMAADEPPAEGADKKEKKGGKKKSDKKEEKKAE